MGARCYSLPSHIARPVPAAGRTAVAPSWLATLPTRRFTRSPFRDEHTPALAKSLGVWAEINLLVEVPAEQGSKTRAGPQESRLCPTSIGVHQGMLETLRPLARTVACTSTPSAVRFFAKLTTAAMPALTAASSAVRPNARFR